MNLIEFKVYKSISKRDFDLKRTLQNGQCFGWKYDEDNDCFEGVIDDIPFQLHQTEDDVYFKAHTSTTNDIIQMLDKYFQFDLCSNEEMKVMFDEWFKEEKLQCFKNITGIRIIAQDPLECFFSFICSANNNIKRITGILQKIRARFGAKLESWDDDKAFYSFPDLDTLAKVSEETWKSLGLGYRAKYFKKSASMLKEKGGRDYLELLKKQDYTEVQKSLIEFAGIGPKVASCIALFSLNQCSIVPIDVHVLNLAQKYFKKEVTAAIGKKTKGLSKSDHGKLQALFIEKLGEYAGWAHSVMFTGDLPEFKHLLLQTKSKPIKATKAAKVELKLDQDIDDELPLKRRRIAAVKDEIVDMKKEQKEDNSEAKDDSDWIP
eukprot:TRINITY_DN766_c2_g3_i1.p1 TRINITY_DN766_c2_g3~~TRINITY_DN766_c2_g3_i1.p1  ORF type:complete len:377 (+),score=104.88 TRINITY_DN766_c2_g3_i1:86-1216(+)